MKRSVVRHFDRAAKTCAAKGQTQREVAEVLIENLPPIDSCRYILDFGSGVGFASELLLRRFEAEVLAVDISPEMIQELRKRLGHNQRLFSEVGDASVFRTDRTCELIVSAAALQWMTPIMQTLNHWHSLLTDDGLLAVSVFSEGTLQALHNLRRELFPNKPIRQNLPSQELLRSAFQEAGFQINDFLTKSFTELYDSTAELLQGVRQLGYTGGPLSLSSTVLTRKELSSLCEEYDARYRDEQGHVPARFEACFVYARKKARACR